MKRLLLALFTFVFFSQFLCAAENTYVYKETTGKTSIISEWRVVSQDGGFLATAESPNEYHRVLCNQGFATISWEYINTEAKTEILAKREGNRILVNGKLKDKQVGEVYEIDDLPWFELVEVSLSRFVQTEEEKVEFWILRPTDLKLFKMVAIKEKTEIIKENGKDVEAVQIKVTVPGLASLFWSVKYWFRKSDGVYIRYEGIRGGPGTPKTIVELIK